VDKRTEPAQVYTKLNPWPRKEGSDGGRVAMPWTQADQEQQAPSFALQGDSPGRARITAGYLGKFGGPRSPLTFSLRTFLVVIDRPFLITGFSLETYGESRAILSSSRV